MLYELRRYQLGPQMTEIFNEHMSQMRPMLEDYGMSIVGAWDTAIGPSMPNHLYMLRWRDLDEREKCWKSFYADPGFQKVMDATRQLAGTSASTGHSVEILRSATYSPLDI